MPSRLLREGILDSDRIEKLDWASEVFYRRLMSKVDDHGLFDARPSTLRTSLYPLRVDRVREADIARWIAACEMAGVIALYVIRGKPYGQMVDTRWQTRSQPKFPTPPWGNSEPPITTVCDRSQLQTPVDLDVFGDGVVFGVGNPPQASPVPPPLPGSGPAPADGKPPAATKQPKGSKRCPKDFSVTAAMVAWAKQNAPGVEVPRETVKFRNHEFAKARSDWPATWQNWILEAFERLGRVNGKSFRERDVELAEDRVRRMTGGVLDQPPGGATPLGLKPAGPDTIEMEERGHVPLIANR